MKIRRTAALLLAIICCLPLAGCVGGEGGADGSTEPEVTDLPDLELNGYTIIRPEDASKEDISLYTGLRGYFRELGEFDIGIKDDFVRRGEEPDPAALEIVCGLTTRPESEQALAALEGHYDYSVTLVGSKLCLSAHNMEALAEAVEYFKANLKVDGEKVLYTGGNYVCRKEYALAQAQIGGVSVKDFAIVYGAGNGREEAVAESLSQRLALLTGKLLPVVADGESAVENEIVIGSAKRDGAVAPDALGKNEYLITVKGGRLVLSAGAGLGYDTVKERAEILMNENKLISDFEEKGTFEIKGLDGAKVMFVGNSFLYYGYCTTTKNKIVFDDQGYFHQVAKGMGDDVYVTSVTYGGAGLKSLYSTMTTNYPNYYGKGEKMDDFYNQDFVILQQEGSNASSTLEYAEKIMALFPPETRFGFFIHHHNAQKNHTNVLNAAKKLRDEKGVIYISAGHVMYDIWNGKVKVPGATLSYNKNSFVVNHSDSHHPNYLNGYLTALSCYYGLTGNSILDCPHDFVRTTKEYYTKAESNYDKILASDADMRGLKQLVEEYIDKYN